MDWLEIVKCGENDIRVDGVSTDNPARATVDDFTSIGAALEFAGKRAQEWGCAVYYMNLGEKVEL